MLAHLLARANQVVARSSLIESLWGDDPPPSAERSLQAYVARLRSALEPGRASGAASAVLVRAGGGYRLRVELEQLDSLWFEELARRGRRQAMRRGSGRSGDAASRAGAVAGRRVR